MSGTNIPAAVRATELFNGRNPLVCWNISHGTNQYGKERRSCTTIGNLAQHLAHVLPAADWRSIAYLFNRRTGQPFTVPEAEADRISQVLYRAAAHSLMPADWAAETNCVADAAARAARAGDPWAWS